MAGCFHQSTIAALATATRADRAIHASRTIRPYNDSSAIAVSASICIDNCVGCDVCSSGMLLGSSALEISTNEHRAAAGIAGRIDPRTVEQANLVTEHLHGAARRAGFRASSG